MGTGGSHLNPNYSGGRDQKDYGLKANSSWDPILKNTHHKNTGGVAQGEDLEFKPQYCKTKQNKTVTPGSLDFLWL
jgi:hypothetical protein